MLKGALRDIDNSWDYEISNGLSEYNKPRNVLADILSSNISVSDEPEAYWNTHCICCGDYLYGTYEDVFLLDGRSELCGICEREMDNEYAYKRGERGVPTVSNHLIGDEVSYKLNTVVYNSNFIISSENEISLSDFVSYNTPTETIRSATATLNSILSEDTPVAQRVRSVTFNTNELQQAVLNF